MISMKILMNTIQNFDDKSMSGWAIIAICLVNIEENWRRLIIAHNCFYKSEKMTFWEH